MVELEVGFYHPRCKKVKFMMELHHGSPKECEASVDASPYELSYPCKLVNGRLHNGASESQNERGVID